MHILHHLIYVLCHSGKFLILSQFQYLTVNVLTCSCRWYPETWLDVFAEKQTSFDLSIWRPTLVTQVCVPEKKKRKKRLKGIIATLLHTTWGLTLNFLSVFCTWCISQCAELKDSPTLQLLWLGWACSSYLLPYRFQFYWSIDHKQYWYMYTILSLDIYIEMVLLGTICLINLFKLECWPWRSYMRTGAVVALKERSAFVPVRGVRRGRIYIIYMYHLFFVYVAGGGGISYRVIERSRVRISRIYFLCWLLFRYPFHPRVTAVARKRPRSFCQKRRWQVTAKHAYTLRMWLCMKWHGAWLYGVHRTRRDWLSGSRFLWHQPCQRCKYTTSMDIQKRAIKSYSLM